MDIHAFIKQQHDEARELMQQITDTSDSELRAELLDELKKSILLHARTEEATYYEAMKEFKELKEKAHHSQEEHETVEDIFAQLDKVRSDNDQFLILFGEVKMGLAHHMHEEEDELFPKTKRLFGKQRSNELGDEMQELQGEYLEQNLPLEAIPHPTPESRL